MGFVKGSDIGQKLIDSGIIPSDRKIRRVIIDIPADGLVKVFMEDVASERVLQIGDILNGTEPVCHTIEAHDGSDPDKPA